MSTTQGPGWRDYTADHTYWTGRQRGEYVEVVRLHSGTFAEEEIWGSYRSTGAAVGAAAQLAYLQGKADAERELKTRLHEVLDSIGLGALPVVAPDLTPGETAQLPADDRTSGR